MAYWNYRIVRYPTPKTVTGEHEDIYALHEIHYDDEGAIYAMAAEPAMFGGETREEVLEMLRLALDGAENFPVVRPEDFPDQSAPAG